MCVPAGCVAALTLTLTAAGGETLGPFRLSRAPQPCFGAGSCDVFEVPEAATATSKLGALQQAKVGHAGKHPLPMRCEGSVHRPCCSGCVCLTDVPGSCLKFANTPAMRHSLTWLRTAVHVLACASPHRLCVSWQGRAAAGTLTRLQSPLSQQVSPCGFMGGVGLMQPLAWKRPCSAAPTMCGSSWHSTR